MFELLGCRSRHGTLRLTLVADCALLIAKCSIAEVVIVANALDTVFHLDRDAARGSVTTVTRTEVKRNGSHASVFDVDIVVNLIKTSVSRAK